MSRQLRQLLSYTRRTARSRTNLGKRISITRDISLFCVAFHTYGRGFDMSCTLGSQVFKLPDGAGFVFSFHFRKTFRSSSHTVVVRSDRECPHICPVRAMGEYCGAAAAIGCDLEQGYLFPPVNEDGSRVTGTPKAVYMTASLQAYQRRAEVPPPNAPHYALLSEWEERSAVHLQVPR